MVLFDYAKLRGKIREKFNTQASFAEAVGMSETTLSERLNNKSMFTQGEITLICSLFDIAVEDIPIYFFTPKVKEA